MKKFSRIRSLFIELVNSLKIESMRNLFKSVLNSLHRSNALNVNRANGAKQC